MLFTSTQTQNNNFVDPKLNTTAIKSHNDCCVEPTSFSICIHSELLTSDNNIFTIQTLVNMTDITSFKEGNSDLN